MARITLYLNKSIEENAGIYFDKAKKMKKKIEGAKEALIASEKKLADLMKKKEKELKKEEKKQTIEREKKWYEKFRWFISSKGLLVVGGRDATTNEIIIKKHTDDNDLVLHTDMAGSPFFVIKSDGKKIDEKTIKEAGDATVTFSRTWRLGLKTTPTFYVKPEQVTKKAKAGEYLKKGSFMIYGKTNYIDNEINLAIGITKDGAIMAGPLDAVKANCEKHIQIEQGNEKTSHVAKQIQHKLGGNLDEIVRALPAGGCKIRK
jgi:predicted ribosome quality control (RQC) complex YloA/Tae2 family protein